MTLGKAAALARVAGFGTLALLVALPLVESRAYAEKGDYRKNLADRVGRPAPDLDYTLRDGSTHKLSDSQGRWVLLELGGTWCPPSREMARVLSQIADQLKDQPFDYLSVYDDPTFDDIDLGTPDKFIGLQALYAGASPEAWMTDGIPALFLIDPQGKVVWSSGAAHSTQLRTAIAWHTGRHLSLPPDFAQAPPDCEAQSNAAMCAFGQQYDQAVTLYADLLKRAPEQASLRIGYAWSLDGSKRNLEGTAWLADQLKDPAHGTDAERYALGEEWADGWKFAEAAQALQPLPDKYPHSVRLKALYLISTKQPEEITPEELDVLLDASDHAHMIYQVRYFTALAAESLGRQAEADALYGSDSMDAGWGREMRIGHLARQWKAAEAASLAAACDGSTTPQTPDRNVSWGAMLRHVSALDWPGAKAYADAHSKSTPWNAAGGAVRLLAAVRTGDAAGKEAAWQELLNFKTDRKAYLFGQKAMTGGPVAETDVAAIAGDEHAFVGLLWAAAAMEAQGKPEEARQIYGGLLRTLRFGSHEYEAVRSLRAALGKAPASPA